MAKLDLKKLHIEAETRFPGDRAKQDAYVELHQPPPAPKNRASTVKKKKTPARKVVKPVAKRRRF